MIPKNNQKLVWDEFNYFMNLSSLTTPVNTLLLIVLFLSLGAQQITIARMKGMMQTAFAKQGTSHTLNGDMMSDSIALAISNGIPERYGVKLNVSFDDVQRSIFVLQAFDPGYGSQKITLADDDLKRYTDIGLRISCEYCCGAQSIVFPDGNAACGCAHSQAMRGLAAYLIQNHGEEYTNDEILRELARWKGMFFPKQMITKMAQALQTGSFSPDTAALVMGKKLPQYTTNTTSAPLPSEIKNLPSMVGGC